MPLPDAPPRVREIRMFLPGRHFVPLLFALLPRSVAYTSLKPLPSRGPRFDASDSNAIARTKRLSFDMTGLVDAPFGMPPPRATDTMIVSWARAAVTSWSVRAPASVTATATSANNNARAAAAARIFEEGRTGWRSPTDGADPEPNLCGCVSRPDARPIAYRNCVIAA